MIIAQDHYARPVGMGLQCQRQRAQEWRAVGAVAGQGEAIPVQRKARGLGPVGSGRVGQAGGRGLRLQMGQHIDGSGVKGGFQRGVARDQPGEQIVAQILQQQKALRRVFRQTARGRQPKRQQMPGDGGKGPHILALVGRGIHQHRRFGTPVQPVITAGRGIAR
jgi:hypothetical protein